MSGIFGIFNKDGAPVSPAHLEIMRSAMARWGPDGGAIWCDGPCGLGQALLYNTSEALHERLPRTVNDRRLAITAAARVDNRDELCDLLNIPAAERPTTADGDLILRSYQRWGEECPNHIYGDWSFAVWRPEQRRLFLARDHHGITALYYIDTPRFFAFATSQKALLSLPQVPKQLNELKFAQRLVYWDGEPEQTLYEGIQHLLPAHTLTITPQHYQKRRYWYLEDVPEIRLPNVEAYAEGLREMLERTVRNQLRSYRDVGLELSGGLDSGGLAALAAPILGERGRSLFTYTITPVPGKKVPTGDRVADEAPWAQAIARHVGNVREHYRDFAESSPIAAIQQLIEIQDAPSIAWANTPWLLGFRSLAQEHGLGVLMNGYMGNATASWQGLLRSQTWATLLWQGPRKAGLRDKIMAMLPYAAVGKFKRWRSGRDWWQTWSVIQPDFAQSMQLEHRLVESEHGIKFHDAVVGSRLRQHQFLSARKQRLAIIEPGRWTGGAWQSTMSAWYGVETRTPLADARLMAYCLGIPDRYYGAGAARGLFRQALAGRLPQDVLWSNRRGLQGADLVARLRTHRNDVEEALEIVQAEPLVTGLLDTSQLQNLWTKIHGTEAINHQHWMLARMFTHGLACGLFLRRWSKGDDAMPNRKQVWHGRHKLPGRGFKMEKQSGRFSTD